MTLIRTRSKWLPPLDGTGQVKYSPSKKRQGVNSEENEMGMVILYALKKRFNYTFCVFGYIRSGAATLGGAFYKISNENEVRPDGVVRVCRVTEVASQSLRRGVDSLLSWFQIKICMLVANVCESPCPKKRLLNFSPNFSMAEKGESALHHDWISSQACLSVLTVCIT